MKNKKEDSNKGDYRIFQLLFVSYWYRRYCRAEMSVRAYARARPINSSYNGMLSTSTRRGHIALP